jgi:hypothetical protein
MGNRRATHREVFAQKAETVANLPQNSRSKQISLEDLLCLRAIQLPGFHICPTNARSIAVVRTELSISASRKGVKDDCLKSMVGHNAGQTGDYGSGFDLENKLDALSKTLEQADYLRKKIKKTNQHQPRND